MSFTRTLQPRTIKERSHKREQRKRARARARVRAPKDQLHQGARVLLSGDLDRAEALDETRVVLLPVDPYLIHAYWVVSSDNLAKTKLLLGEDYERAQTVLRFHDVTCILFNGSNAHSSFDVPIDLRTGNWYVRLWSPEKSYCADLGLRMGDGRFFSIARSNAAQTPRDCPTTRREDCYMLIEGNYRHVEQISVRVEKGPAVSQRVIQTKKSHRRRVSMRHSHLGQAEGKEIARETELFSSRGIEHDPVGKEDLSKYGRLLWDQVMPIIRHVEMSLEGPPSVDLTAISEKSFASGLSSKVSDRPIRKIVV